MSLFPDLGFGSDQLNFQTQGEMKAITFLFRSKRIRFADKISKRVRSRARKCEGSDD